MGYSFYELDNINKKNTTLKKAYNKISDDIKKIENENNTYNSEINNLKESNKDKVWELETWIKAKEKLEKAL